MSVGGAVVGGTVIIGGAAIGLVELQNQFHDEANMYWGSETGWNDASDAFRHSYVSTRFAQYFGAKTPEVLGNLHEAVGDGLNYYDGSKSDPRDDAMDVYNNKVGAEVGVKYDIDDYESPQKIAAELKKSN